MTHSNGDSYGDPYGDTAATVPDELVARHRAAVEAYHGHDYDTATELFEDVRRGSSSALGPMHRHTLTVAGNLAVATFNAGYHHDGLALIRSAVAVRARVLGDDDPQTLSAREALATALRLTGKVDDALDLAAHVTAQRAHRLGATHPDTLTSRVGLAIAHAAAGDIDLAHAALRSTIEAAADAHGRDDPVVATLVEAGQHADLLRPRR
jgi:hypothetical protein